MSDSKTDLRNQNAIVQTACERAGVLRDGTILADKQRWLAKRRWFPGRWQLLARFK